ncbi:hypothetical protein SAY87_028526 [Trapa incisa]|uniref:Uncharacterized protein n=1 Tax=Trapa incisa TaxID=236973 RepID=A0AAN7QPD0_9MYRT|nr:hypothetical protein SAY87_028526 [Trapa incisa]
MSNVILFAGIPNRTLIVPPVLDHHVVALGSCPKFMVLGPTEIRAACLYAVDEDCKNTVWIYQREDKDGKLELFQPNEQLRKKKKISYIRRRQDVYKTLRHGTKAGSMAVVAFGNLFTSPYRGSQLLIDIPGAPLDQTMQVHEIVRAEIMTPVSIVEEGKLFEELTTTSSIVALDWKKFDRERCAEELKFMIKVIVSCFTPNK